MTRRFDLVGFDERGVGRSSPVLCSVALLDAEPSDFPVNQAEFKQALTELREVIRGVHPQVLTDRALAAAITDAASRSPTSVDVDVDLPHRPPVPVEIAAYFAVSEALTNIDKHSRAGRARIYGRLAAGQLVLEIRDGGIAARIRPPAPA